MEYFKKLTKEKQDRIINAGFTCFAKNGYEKASMADIAKLAQVSKASLFQYFGNKIDFYLYLYKLCISMNIKNITDLPQPLPNDFFDRMAIIHKIMIEVTLQYNGMYDFLYASLAENAPEIKERIRNTNAEYVSISNDIMLKDINWDKFKPGIDLEMVMNMITWIDQGYTKSLIGKNMSLDELSEDMCRYMDLLKQSIYKEECLNEGN